MSCAIFDMDGLLIDSEPHWRVAEVDVLGSLGVPLTEQMCEQTTGLRIDEVVAYWHQRHPWNGDNHTEVAAAIVDRVGMYIAQDGVALPGVVDTVRSFKSAGWRLALASSSPPSLIEAGVEALGLTNSFEFLCSAANEERGKPDPAVYLTTAQSLGVSPTECIAFEDSLPGVQAAKAAGMRVVAVPAPSSFDDPQFMIADWKLRSLEDFQPSMLES